jgi:glycosyltransferase involved in cell wall biosynthesis
VIGDGELKQDLMRYAQQLQIDDQVLFSGWVKDVARIYADLDVLALTSLNEGTPVSIIEAMAGSVPVVATDAGGVKDLLGHCPAEFSPGTFQQCERGILCRNNDPTGFARALRYLIEMEPVCKKRLIDRARVYVEKEYSKERLFRETENLYVSLFNNRGPLEAGQGKMSSPRNSRSGCYSFEPKP